MAFIGGVLFFLFFISILGAFPAWIVVYFRNGFSIVKARHGVDWREFMLSIPGFWLANVLFWPIGIVVWLIRGLPSKSLAVVRLDGREVRRVVSSERFDVKDGVATSK